MRAFIAEHAPPFEAREGRRAPEDAEQEELLRTWFAALVRRWVRRRGLAGRTRRSGRPPSAARSHRERGDPARPRAAARSTRSTWPHTFCCTSVREEQKRTLLPPIRRSEHVWCQLLSEPDAGSDIAAVRSRGVRQDDGSWVIDGQKTWITDGHWADMGLALIRTDPSSSRHHGLSVFAVPLSAPGVEVRPIRTISDAIEVNEVFLDGCRLSADGLIGEAGQGWSIIMAGLDFERFGIGGNVILLELLIDDLVTRGAACALSTACPRWSTTTSARRWPSWPSRSRWRRRSSTTTSNARSRCRAAGDGSIAKLSFAETYHRVSAYGAELRPLPCDA